MMKLRKKGASLSHWTLSKVWVPAPWKERPLVGKAHFPRTTKIPGKVRTFAIDQAQTPSRTVQ